MLVYVAVALAVALVLRRGDGPAVLAGVSSESCLSSPTVSRRACSRITSARPTTRLTRIGSRAARVLERLRAARGDGRRSSSSGFVAHSRRARRTLRGSGHRSRARHGPVLHVLAGLVDGARRLLSWRRSSSIRGDCASSGHWSHSLAPAAVAASPIASQPGCADDGGSRAARAREGHRLRRRGRGVVAASLAACWPRTSSRRRGRVQAERSRRGRCVLLGAVARRGRGRRLVGVGGPAKGFCEVIAVRSRADVAADRISTIGSSASPATAERSRSVSPGMRAIHPLVGQRGRHLRVRLVRASADLLVVRDAHSLYVESLGEIGIVGVLLARSERLSSLVAGRPGAPSSVRRRRDGGDGRMGHRRRARLALGDGRRHDDGVPRRRRERCVAAERAVPKPLGDRARRPLVGTVALSLAATWSLVGNQALFAARRSVGTQRLDGGADARSPRPSSPVLVGRARSRPW